jgi:hypothetical protein
MINISLSKSPSHALGHSYQLCLIRIHYTCIRIKVNLRRHHIQPITNLSRLSFKKFEKPLKKIGVRGALPPPYYQLQGRPPYTTSTAMRIKPTWLKSCRFRTQKKISNFNGSWYIYRSTSAAYNCPEQQFLSFIALFISRQSNLFAFL